VDCPDLPLIVGPGKAKAVIWPDRGALYRTFQVFDMESGAKTVDFKHLSDSVYYVVTGGGEVVDTVSGKRADLTEGAMVHIDRGDGYRFETKAGMRIIGGPCPADPTLYAHLLQTEAV
jgi:mannose-6-phosphate isomerase-like protein (cupin superfamily)